jgi:hypothetical protein
MSLATGTGGQRSALDPPEAVRRAFGQGVTPTAADALVAARAAGLDWETAARAVALGLADHFGVPLVSAADPRKPGRGGRWTWGWGVLLLRVRGGRLFRRARLEQGGH